MMYVNAPVGCNTTIRDIYIRLLRTISILSKVISLKEDLRTCCFLAWPDFPEVLSTESQVRTDTFDFTGPKEIVNAFITCSCNGQVLSNVLR